MAEHLAKTVQAKLILIGRSAFPSPEEWEQWLNTHEEQNPMSLKIRKIQKLEKLGAEVLVICADVTKVEEMEQTIATAQKRFGTINGAIHAAGIPGGGIIERKTPEMAEKVLAPKVRGTLILDNLLKNVQLDFFVLCSARTAIVGGFGQIDYCSANAFLDAFAHYKNQQSKTFTLSIDWSAWQEVGMAAKVPKKRPGISYSPQIPEFKEELLPSEGIEVFKRILGNTLVQIIVSTYDLMMLGEQEKVLKAIFLSEISEKENLFQLSKLSNTDIALYPEIKQTLADIWQDILGIHQLDFYDNFFKIGGDSLSIVQVRSQLQKRLNINISISDLFEYPTINSLAEYLSQKQTENHNLPKITRAKRGNSKNILTTINQISEQQVDSLIQEIEILSKNDIKR